MTFESNLHIIVRFKYDLYMFEIKQFKNALYLIVLVFLIPGHNKSGCSYAF